MSDQDSKAKTAHHANVAQIIGVIIGIPIAIISLVIALISIWPKAASGSSTVFIPTPSPPSVSSATSTLPVMSTVTTNPPTATSAPLSASYSTDEPGAGCDMNGASWNERNLDEISCTSSGTDLVINPSGTQGYLYLQQLPHNQMFSTNNTVSVTSGLGDLASGYQEKCVGLGYLGTVTGYDAEYCNDGSWFIAATSNEGVTLNKIDHGVVAMLTTAEISLTLKKNLLAFSVNGNMVDSLQVSSIQPIKIAIVYNCVGYGADQTIGGNYLLVQGFSYVTPAS